jgi:hypothetical protein
MASLQRLRKRFWEEYQSVADSHERWRDRDESSRLVLTARALVDHYSAWNPHQRTATSAVEIFAPTLLRIKGLIWRSNAHHSDPDPAPLNETQFAEWLRGILHLCLYADQVYVPDPLEILAHVVIDDSVVELAIHEPLVMDRSLCVDAAQALVKVEPLIDAGVVVLYPPMHCYHAFVSEDLFGSDRGFTSQELDSAWPDLYVSEGLHYAKAFDASYTALHPTEYKALEKASNELGKSLGLLEGRVLASLPLMKLPFLRRWTLSPLSRWSARSFVPLDELV